MLLGFIAVAQFKKLFFCTTQQEQARTEPQHLKQQQQQQRLIMYHSLFSVNPRPNSDEFVTSP